MPETLQTPPGLTQTDHLTYLKSEKTNLVQTTQHIRFLHKGEVMWGRECPCRIRNSGTPKICKQSGAGKKAKATKSHRELLYASFRNKSWAVGDKCIHKKLSAENAK